MQSFIAKPSLDQKLQTEGMEGSGEPSKNRVKT